MSPQLNDAQAVRKALKIFVGGLPEHLTEHALGSHFSRYGQVVGCSVVSAKNKGDGKSGGAPFAFVSFRNAADADACIVDQAAASLPGAHRPLQLKFATTKKKDEKDEARKRDLVGDGDPCKVFVGGISDRDSEEEVGDFFSQWGLVALIYRDQTSWGFVHYATKEAALRLLEENSIVYQRRRLDVKPADSKRPMDENERQDLIHRSIARHFHKKQTQAQQIVPHAGYHPAPVGPPGYPPHGHYGAPPPGYPPPHSGYPPHAPPPGYAPQGYPPPGYQPHGAPPHGGAPPPGHGPCGYYGAPPPAANYYGAPPPGAPPPGGPPGAPPALTDYDHHRSPPPSAAPPPTAAPPAGGAGFYVTSDPYGPGPEGTAPAGPPAGPGAYYRDSRGGEGHHPTEHPPPTDYYRNPAPTAGAPPPAADSYYRVAPSAAPPHGGGPPPVYGGAPAPSQDPRYRPY